MWVTCCGTEGVSGCKTGPGVGGFCGVVVPLEDVEEAADDIEEEPPVDIEEQVEAADDEDWSYDDSESACKVSDVMSFSDFLLELFDVE